MNAYQKNNVRFLELREDDKALLALAKQYLYDEGEVTEVIYRRFSDRGHKRRWYYFREAFNRFLRSNPR